MRMYEELCNKYRIEQLLGNGTYGAVFQASETRCERTVAIKAFHKDRYDQGTRRYLESEIRTMGRLWGHPNVVAIHTVEPGEDPYLAFLVMEYVDGPNLRNLIDRGPISLEAVLCIGIDVCRGLAHAHQQNIIHRDVKPQNILLTSDLTAKLSDFGVARILERSGTVGTVAGTRKYMAPEQYVPNYDHRVDLYATGLVLFEMLVRDLPFSGIDSKEIEEQKQTRDPEIPDSIHPGMRPIIRHALMRDPDRRYQTAEDLLRDLDQLRRRLYQEYVLEVMKRHRGSSMIESVLATRRERWGLSPDAAMLIEERASRLLEKEREKSRRASVMQKTASHYMRTRELIANQQFPDALSELQQLILSYLTDEQAARLVSDLFVRLADADMTEKVMDPEWLQRQIECLPAEKRTRLIHELAGETFGSPSPVLPPVRTAPTELQEPISPQRIAEIEDSERRARHYQRRAEEHRRVGNVRQARRLLRRIGRIYWKMAERLLREQMASEVPGYYMRAARAYGEVASLGSRSSLSSRISHRKSRQCYLRAAKTNFYLAEQAHRQQKWADAAEGYRRSARGYDLADKRSASNEANRQAMSAYYQAAQELFRYPNPTRQVLEAARDACETAVQLAQQMRGHSAPAEQAHKLLIDIDAQLESLLGGGMRSNRFFASFGNRP